MNWWFKRCRRYEASLSLLAVGALREEAPDQVLSHFAKCENCRATFAELQKLARGLTEAGRRLPEVEASVSLRRRWMAVVRRSVAESDGALRTGQPAQGIVLAWLAGRRLAWGSLAAMWALVLFFRFSAPDAPQPASSVAVVPPLSLRQVLLALKVDERGLPARVGTGRPVYNKQSPPDTRPPRSQRPGTQSTTDFNIT